MKNTLIILVAFLISLFVALPTKVSAKENREKEPTFKIVEKMPKFDGGKEALIKFLSTNIKYPDKAQKEGITGKVCVQFVVTKTGKVDQAKVLKGADPLLDAEAVRVVRSMPYWTPGTQRGRKVNVEYTLPINFALDKKK